MIGKIGLEPNANAFGAFLESRGVEHELEPDGSGAWMVWVADEEQVESASGDLDRFLENPDHDDFSPERNRERLAGRPGPEARRKGRTLGRDDLFAPMRAYGVGPLTFGIVFVCVALALLTDFGKDMGRAGALYIAELTRMGTRLSGIAGCARCDRVRSGGW